MHLPPPIPASRGASVTRLARHVSHRSSARASRRPTASSRLLALSTRFPLEEEKREFARLSRRLRRPPNDERQGRLGDAASRASRRRPREAEARFRRGGALGGAPAASRRGGREAGGEATLEFRLRERAASRRRLGVGEGRRRGRGEAEARGRGEGLREREGVAPSKFTL